MSGKRIVAYFTDWSIYARNFYPWLLNTQCLTNVMYAFVEINASGQAQFLDTWADTGIVWTNQGDSWNDPATDVHGCINQLFQLKKANRHLKTSLSFGGWTLSNNFSTVFSTAAGRQTFVASAIQMMLQYGFDGIDLDWEFPGVSAGNGNAFSANDGANFVALLQEFRTQFAAIAGGYPWLLSVAVSTVPANYAGMQLAQMSPLVDFFNLMSYDYAGSWSSTTGHQSNLYPYTGGLVDTDSAINAFIANGIDPSKLVLGYPSYGRGWTGVTPNHFGLNQPYTGTSAGNWEQGIYDYKTILNTLVPSGYQVMWDATAQQSFLWSAQKQEWVAFDDATTVYNKALYVNQKGLGGLMTWEASADAANDSSSNLINVARTALNSFDNSRNNLYYPTSTFTNINNLPNDYSAGPAPTPSLPLITVPTLPSSSPSPVPEPAPVSTLAPALTPTPTPAPAPAPSPTPGITLSGLPGSLQYIVFNNVSIDGQIIFNGVTINGRIEFGYASDTTPTSTP